MLDVSAFSLFKIFLGCYGRKRLPNGIPFLRFEPKSQIFRVREAIVLLSLLAQRKDLFLCIAVTYIFILKYKII